MPCQKIFLSFQNMQFPPNNDTIHNIAEIIKATADAKLGALYINACKGGEIKIILKEMGMQIDNLTIKGITNSCVQPKNIKAMNIRFHWLHDISENQKQFEFFWRQGLTNLPDY